MKGRLTNKKGGNMAITRDKYNKISMHRKDGASFIYILIHKGKESWSYMTNAIETKAIKELAAKHSSFKKNNWFTIGKPMSDQQWSDWLINSFPEIRERVENEHGEALSKEEIISFVKLNGFRETPSINSTAGEPTVYIRFSLLNLTLKAETFKELLTIVKSADLTTVVKSRKIESYEVYGIKDLLTHVYWGKNISENEFDNFVDKGDSKIREFLSTKGMFVKKNEHSEKFEIE